MFTLFKVCAFLQEKDTFNRIANIITNCALQAYLPLEHVFWLCEHGVLSMNPKPWFTRTFAVLSVVLFTAAIKLVK